MNDPVTKDGQEAFIPANTAVVKSKELAVGESSKPDQGEQPLERYRDQRFISCSVKV